MTSTAGGPSRKGDIGRAMLWIESGVLVLVLAACGGGDRPDRLREPDAGDEQPIELRVEVRATADATTVAPRRIAAFLPVRFVVRGSPVRVAGLGRVKKELRSPGLEPGRVRIVGRGGPAVLRVVSGG